MEGTLCAAIAGTVLLRRFLPQGNCGFKLLWLCLCVRRYRCFGLWGYRSQRNVCINVARFHCHVRREMWICHVTANGIGCVSMFGPLLEVELSKKCTLLWREAHVQVKMYKTLQPRSTFGSCDVEKVHAVVAEVKMLKAPWVRTTF